MATFAAQLVVVSHAPASDPIGTRQHCVPPAHGG
jgi:hypothetical protein